MLSLLPQAELFYFISNSMAKLIIKNKYAQVPNSLLEKKDVTLRAKGVYAYIQSRPESWDFSIDKIASSTGETSFKIKYALQELTKAGYLKRIKFSNGRGKFGIEYHLYDQPCFTSVGVSTDDTSFDDISTDDTPTDINKNEFIKKDSSNKEGSKEISEIPEQTELLTNGFKPSTSTSFLNGINKPVEKTTQAEQEPIHTSTSNTPLPPADRVQAVLRKGLGRDGLDEILNQTDIPFPDLVAIFIDYWVYQQGRTFNPHQHKGMASSFQKWFEIGKTKELPKAEIKNGIKSNPVFEKIVERVERMKVGIQMTNEQSSAIKKFLNENKITDDILMKTTRDFCDGASNDWNVWLKIAQRNANQLLTTK